ncbi:transaldolase [Alphaproteobacteria bacterium]|nr:transaldolase [Alphaproteobacteria bacterium]
MESLKKLIDLNIQIYLDGADLEAMRQFTDNERINGFTSNPSLMYQNDISNYKDFILNSLNIIKGKPISFEVVSDELSQMLEQSKRISAFGKNIYVKIPITNTKGVSTIPVIKDLAKAGIPLNITAILTSSQAIEVIKEINEPSSPIILSIFAGRIADTGIDPKITFNKVKENIRNIKNYKTLWASPREIYNLYEANDIGADIITITPQILKKTNLFQKDLNEYSLETVKMFYDDAQKNNLEI